MNCSCILHDSLAHLNAGSSFNTLTAQITHLCKKKIEGQRNQHSVKPNPQHSNNVSKSLSDDTFKNMACQIGDRETEPLVTQGL